MIRIAQGVLGKTIKLPVKASTTIAKDTAVTFDGGYLIPAVAGTANVKYLALEGVVAGAGENPLCLCVNIGDTRIESDCDGTVAQTLVGTFIDLKDATELDAAASTTDVFFVESVDTQNDLVYGYFVK